MSQDDHINQIRLEAISIVGADAAAFLQSQLTMDVNGINDEHLHPAAWCSPNGRVDALVLIALEDKRATLVMPEGLAEATLKRARMFSIGRQVKIYNGFCAHPFDEHKTPDVHRLALSFDASRTLTVRGKPDSGTIPALPADWVRADIDCALPWILPETSGAFLPQMLGLEALGGLSYKKGCFPGQEVIARVHYRGRVKQKPAQFRLDADRAPAPGAQFELAGTPSSVLYAVAGAAETTGLAVVSADADPGADFMIDGNHGALVPK